MGKVKFTLLSIKNIYSLIKINIFKKDFLINILWIFLLSLIFFYSFSISFKFYFSILLGVWIFLILQYPIDKNENWYIQFIFFSIINSISFYLVRYFQKKNFLILSIKILITYYLILFCIILFKCVYYTSKTNLENDGDLFVERKYDLERLLNYLNYFSIIGINGEWGSGKSFLTDHLKNFILIKIDLLSCNVDEIQTVILNELDKLLKNQGIFSPFSPKLKKILQQGKLFENISQLFVKNDISYSEAITGLRNNLRSINKPVVIVYEDLDRVENTTVIKQILDISEKIAGNNIKILYQFSETNLFEKGIERTYLEKYIPFILNLTDIPFKSTLSYVLKQEIYQDFLLNEEDFNFLYLPVYLPHFNNINRPLTSMRFELKNISIRKTQLFLNELNQVINEKEIYKKNKRVVIIFFLLKHFYYDAYKKLSSGESILDTFTFLYQDKNDTILNWFVYCQNEGISILDLMTTEDNKLSAFIISIFEYNCDIETINNDFEDFINEARNNLKNKNLNEQKNRIIWNLIGNGKSEYTDCEKFINTFYNEVINTPKTEWFQNFNNFTENLFNRKYKGMEKRDNNTIFRMGIPIMVSLFQANYVTGRTALEWKNLIDFYFLYNDYSKDLDTITPRLIECLCYCELSDRSFYLYVINKFNNLKVTKNLNSHKSYKRFLLEYLSMFSTLGFCDTYDIWDLREQSKEYINVKTIEKNVFLPLKKKLENLFSNVQIKIVQKDIEIIIRFLDKNIEIINTPDEFSKPALFSNANWSMRSTNQEMVDKLNSSTLNDEEFEKEVIKKYQNQELVPYEVAELERFQKNKA